MRRAQGECPANLRSRVCGIHAFQACAFNHSATSPVFKVFRLRLSRLSPGILLGTILRFERVKPHTGGKKPAFTIIHRSVDKIKFFAANQSQSFVRTEIFLQTIRCFDFVFVIQ